MHNLTKIRLFRLLLKLSWLPALVWVYPFSLLRRKLAVKHIFFFDRYSLGGAQRVHIDILNAIPELPKLVLFTRHSPDDVMKAAFEAVPNDVCRDIHFWCDNLLFRLFAVHYWAFYLNRHRGLKILSSNSTFFYDLLPWLRKDFSRIELLHNFTYGKKGMEFFGLANYRYLDKRLAVDYATAQNIRRQYSACGISETYSDKIQVIEPGVYIPAQLPLKAETPLRVLYAGRGGAQKRVWLIDRIAARCYEQEWPLVFHFAGDVTTEITDAVKAQSVMHGQISEPHKMHALYADCHVIILTSAYEGFPMVIKEGMANGCIPLVTSLPGNRTHLKNNMNALLINVVDDENEVVAESLQHLKTLLANTALKAGLKKAAFEYAQEHFGKGVFTAAYQQLLTEDTKTY